MTDGAGTVVGSQQYDAFGATRTQTRVQLPFGFAGEQYDAERGLVYLRNRYYDPLQGRFLTTDPLGIDGGSASLYSYVGNNPTNGTDPNPSGLCPWCIIAGAIGVGAVVGGVAGAAGSVVTQYAAGDHSIADINWKDVVVAGVTGAVAGGTTMGLAELGVAPGVIGTAVIGGEANVAQYAITKYVNGEAGSFAGAAESAAWGGIVRGADVTLGGRLNPELGRMRWSNELNRFDPKEFLETTLLDRRDALKPQVVGIGNFVRSCGASVITDTNVNSVWHKASQLINDRR